MRPLRQQARRARVALQLARFSTRRVPAWIAIARTRPGDGLRVSYGREHVPRLDERAYGGVVKFQQLASVLPNHPRDYNVLYFGSTFRPLDSDMQIRLARRRRAPFAWNQNGVAYPAWAGDDYERINKPNARACHAADHVFFQSAFCKLAADRYYGERQGPSEVLHNPVDTSRFVPQPHADRPLTLLLGGNQYQRYRLETALHTLALLDGARMVVTGALSFAPDAEDVTRRLIRELGLDSRVDLAGAYTQAEAPAVLPRGDILLHTKVNDPCPTIVLEAMACGLPVVYDASGGTPELVGADAGEGVPTTSDWEVDRPPEPELLAAAVRRVAERLSDVSAIARTRAVEHFDLQPWIERHRSVFYRLSP